MNISESRSCLEKLLNSQKLAVLATQSNDSPYTNLIAFSIINDYKRILFTTLKTTSKYNNLIQNKKVAICFDDRKDNLSDFYQTITATAIGTATEVKKEDYKDLFLSYHPNMADFVNKKDCAIIEINVNKYILVRNFQKVSTIKP